MKTHLSSEQASFVVRLAWEDRTSFEEIRERTGLVESQVIDLMRRAQSDRGFEQSRKRAEIAGKARKSRVPGHSNGPGQV
ncbi:DUF2805 domain-containing protein [Prosthecobacter vanneervenii]|uniref:Uncharacterized protein (TIGR03643 family) n=1 Tax=Prosthecobacter vanneervenii TaxID=48466 RepID=A0A7W7YBM6_9BACT|nr:DUF2805 domain-containing protein [Prosthecobacter vanneervenii]MBB5033130.1 uncharacterized protein (TIGR03643 family) [Prosthecobacter vanneervenii]